MWKIKGRLKSQHSDAGKYISNVLLGLGIAPVNENILPDRTVWVTVPLSDAQFVAWIMLRHSDVESVSIEEVKYGVMD